MSALTRALERRHAHADPKPGSTAYSLARERTARDTALLTTRCGRCGEVVHEGMAGEGRDRFREHARGCRG